jgi:hypothetical protein
MKRVLPILLVLLGVMLIIGLVTLTQRDVLLRLVNRPEVTPEPEAV